ALRRDRDRRRRGIGDMPVHSTVHRAPLRRALRAYARLADLRVDGRELLSAALAARFGRGAVADRRSRMGDRRTVIGLRILRSRTGGGGYGHRAGAFGMGPRSRAAPAAAAATGRRDRRLAG